MEETKPPRCIERRYAILWNEFKDSNFRMDDAVRVLIERNKDREEEVPVFLSEMRKGGLLKSELDPYDARKRIHTLKKIYKDIDDIIDMSTTEITRSEIDALLKKAADLIRTRVDYSFILILLFLKRISDKWELDFENAKNEAIEDGLTREEAEVEAKNAAYHDFDFPEEYLWGNIRKDVSTLPERLSEALKTLAERNTELKDVIDNVDFIQFTTSRENAEILRQLVELFSVKKLQHVSPDVLGDAYEWVLGYFAPQKAKEGEVYTRREVIKLLVEILDPKPGESVYDPASASNGMLIISYKHVEEKRGKSDADKLFLFGQEANHKTLALGRMNLYIHDIKNAHVAYGDTLLYPKFKDGERLKQFDVVIANPPWNQDGYEEERVKKGEFWKQRFRYGFVPKQSADWAWVQHMAASAKGDTGRVGVVIDNGCLFRGGKEKAIRQAMLDEDLIESVFLLPEKLFYNTGAPGAVVVLNRNKPENRKGKVLFINASSEFEQHPGVRKLNRLGDKHTRNIANAYRDFDGGDGFARAVSIDEIKENDYNLNVTLYVFPEEEIEEIDVAGEWRELKIIEEEIAGVEGKIERYLEVIG